MSELGRISVLSIGGWLPPLVLVQKGLNPDGTAPIEFFLAQRRNLKVLLLTGAAFGEDVVNRAPVEMILSQRQQDFPIAKAFAECLGETIWPLFTTDFRGVSIRNTLRTIASFQQGAAAGYLARSYPQQPRSTVASVFAAIAAESRIIARAMHVPFRTLDPNKGVGRALEADLTLCQVPESRNFALGWAVGQGLSVEEAQEQVQGTTECLTNIPVVTSQLYYSPGPSDDEIPWFQATTKVIHGTITVDQAVNQIFARRDRRFH